LTIFLHIRRTTPDLYYFRTARGNEIDFIWADVRGSKNLLQVCITLDDPLTAKREITSLLQAMDELDLQESTIVSLQEEKEIEKDNKKIRIVPAWKFLIKDHKIG
jgi:predicted AAA+ superfamily ATPase